MYLSTNKLNGKVYIGITTRTLRERIGSHISSSRTSSSHNYYFSNAILKYGPDSFEWEIIDTGFSEDELNEKEIFYIDLYQSYLRENGYNLTYGGDGCRGNAETRARISASNLGKKRSDESKKRMSEVQKERQEEYGPFPQTEQSRKKISDNLKDHPVSDETRLKLSLAQQGQSRHERPVLKLDKEGNVIERFDSIVEASRISGYSFSTIYGVCSGAGNTCGGWVWKYDDERYEEIKKEREEEKKHKKGVLTQKKVPSKKAVFKLDKEGKIVAQYSSMHEAGEQCHISQTLIANVCEGRTKSCGGWGWKYANPEENIAKPLEKIKDLELKEENLSRRTKAARLAGQKSAKVVQQLDLSGNLVEEFPSLYAVGRSYGLLATTVSAACKKGKPYRGFLWRFKNESDRPKND